MPIILLFSLFFMSFGIWGIVKGEVWAKGSSYKRSEEPVLFWIAVGVYIGGAFSFVAYALYREANL